VLSEPHAETRSPSAHLGAVDWLRLISIIGVAYYHAFTIWYPDSIVGPYAFAGLHALTAASVYFAALSRSATSDRDIVAKRFHRLLVPWLAFSLLFMAMAMRSGKFRTSMLWTGGSTHLWFLPFIFVVGCAIAMVRRRGLIVRSVASTAFWSALAIIGIVVEPHIGPHLTKTEPVWQIVNALPSVFVGLAIYTLPERGGQAYAVAQLVAFAVAGLVAWTFEPATTLAWSGAAACGGVIFGIARLLPIHATPASSFAARTSFGVYLLHMLALSVVIKIVAKVAHQPLNAHDAIASDSLGLVIAAQVALAIVGSLIAVAILERTPLRRFVG
jgi:peptidoglycan/LPS O-acetylase OafA/YrhL